MTKLISIIREFAHELGDLGQVFVEEHLQHTVNPAAIICAVDQLFVSGSCSEW